MFSRERGGGPAARKSGWRGYRTLRGPATARNAGGRAGRVGRGGPARTTRRSPPPPPSIWRTPRGGPAARRGYFFRSEPSIASKSLAAPFTVALGPVSLKNTSPWGPFTMPPSSAQSGFSPAEAPLFIEWAT
jgi:hypothetical protein